MAPKKGCHGLFFVLCYEELMELDAGPRLVAHTFLVFVVLYWKRQYLVVISSLFFRRSVHVHWLLARVLVRSWVLGSEWQTVAVRMRSKILCKLCTVHFRHPRVTLSFELFAT